MSILNEFENEVKENPESKYYYKIELQVNEISKILRKIRVKKDVSQIQIARQTGLSKQMVSKIESYNGNPTLNTFVKYCDCVGINLLDLLEKHLSETQ